MKAPAVVTAGAVVLAFLALDDITTDVATTGFLPERLALTACAIWFLIVTRGLWQQSRRTLAAVSFGLLVLSALAQPFMATRTAPGIDLPFQATVPTLAWLPYLATVATLAWFLLLSRLAFMRPAGRTPAT